MITVQPRRRSPNGVSLRVPVSRGLLGRERDLVRLAVAARRARLVTILGPGGIGKTRLAVERARGRVPLISLQGVKTPTDLAEALRDALGLRTPGAIRPRPTSVAGLAARLPRRLILDNAEDLSPEAVRFVGDLLRLAPNASFLATSRRALQLPEEVALPLGPLSPAASRKLFLRHAEKGIDPALLDGARGFPLAILLAARGALPGLKPRERRLLGGLAVFSQSFGDADIEAVVGEVDPLDLDALEGACLIGRPSPRHRWRMLAPVREAARTLVRQEPLRAAHASRFEALARAGDAVALEGVESELSAALDYLLENHQAERAARMAVSLVPWACDSGRSDRAEGWLRRLNEELLAEEQRVAVLDGLGRALLTAGRWQEAIPHLSDAAAVYERRGDGVFQARAHGNLGMCYRLLGDAERAALHAWSAVVLFREAGDTPRLAATLNNISQILSDGSYWKDALQAQRQCVELHPTDSRRVSLAEALLHNGLPEEARAAVRSVLSGSPDASTALRAQLLDALLSGASPEELAFQSARLDEAEESMSLALDTRRLLDLRIAAKTG